MPFLFLNHACCALLILALSIQAATEIHVSPEGNDSAPGTLQQPLRTLTAAQDKVRASNSAMSDDIIVFLHAGANGGYYHLDSTLHFDERDGGTNGHTVTYRNFNDSIPVLSGGFRVDNWEMVSGTTPQQWKAHVDRTTKIRALTVNYIPGIRAQGPQIMGGEEWGTYNDGSEGFYVYSGATIWGKKTGPINIEFSNPGDVEVYKWGSWVTDQLCVDNLVESGTRAKIKMQNPAWRINLFKSFGHKFSIKYNKQSQQWDTLTTQYLLENAYEFLDMPNEFYFDRSTKTLYYIPREGVDMNNAVVIVPRVEVLMNVHGSSPDKKVENLAFRGIAFHDDNYLLPKIGDSRGYSTVQGVNAFMRPVQGPDWKDDDITYWLGHLQIQAAIHVMFAQNITIEQCRFEYLGGSAIALMNDVHNTLINGNIFRFAGGNAVTIGHDEHGDLTETYPQELYPCPAENDFWIPCSHITVSNNITRNVSWQFTHAPVIQSYFTHDCKFLHNDLGPCGYDAFSIGWGWGKMDKSQVQRNNEASFNKITGAVQYHGDGGSFYTLGDQRGLICDGNFFSDTWGENELINERRWMSERKSLFLNSGGKTMTKGYYPDASSENITYRNTVFELDGPTVGTWFDLSSSNVKVENAWWADDGKGVQACEKNGAQCSGTLQSYPYGQRPPEAQAIVDKAGLEPAYEELIEALDWTPGRPGPVAVNRRKPGTDLMGLRKYHARIIGAGRPVLALHIPYTQRVVVLLYSANGRCLGEVFQGKLTHGLHRIDLTDGCIQHRGVFSLLEIRLECGRLVLPGLVTLQ